MILLDWTDQYLLRSLQLVEPATKNQSDDLDNCFCESRGTDPNTDVKGTYTVIAGQIPGVINYLAGSNKIIVDTVHTLVQEI